MAGGIGTDIVTTVADATKKLQHRYISSRFSSSVDDWPQYRPEHYTTLAFIHNKGESTDAVRFFVAQKLAAAGNINTSQFYRHSSINANMTKNISDIFLPVMASDGSFKDLHVLIEGAPGIGKTVLAKEIAYQWAKKELLTSKKLLLLVFLRDCHQKPLKSIEDLVQHVFSSSEITAHLTNYLSRTDGEDAVIVFDGYDELSDKNRNGSIILDIIGRKTLTKICLVITSRPTASANLHGSVDRRVEIVGFTEEDRLDYIQTAFENHDEHIKALQHYLQSNPTINALCYIPLNMTALLCLAKDGIDSLPKTQTEMYRIFIEITIVRFIKKNHENYSTVIRIAKLPQPYDTLFSELANLAYEALKTDKIVFTLPEIEEGCPNLTMTTSNWNGLGLLKAVQCFSAGNDQVTFHFLHFSIQEYMAAWYISKLPNKKQIELLQETFWEHRYYNTWIMYVGITGGNSFALQHFLSGNHFQFYSKLFKTSKVSNKYLKHKMKCLHLFQCLVEANQQNIMQSVKQLFQNKQVDLSNQTLLPSDLNTLGYFLIRSINKEWDVLNLSNCNIGSNGGNILCDTFKDKDVRCIVNVKMVNFSHNQLDLPCLTRLFGLFKSWHTTEIIITDDALLDNITDIKMIEDIVLQSSTLTLVFIGSFLFVKNLQSSKTFHILSATTNIKSMYLLNCNWKSSNYKVLDKLLDLLKNQKLHKVRIINSSLNKIFILKLASTLLNNNDSVNMFVYDPTMSDQIADEISSLILSLYKDISGVMLIVSNSKVQGIVNTCTLNDELSTLELFNLNMYLITKTSPWSQKCNLEHNDKSIAINTFVALLHKMTLNSQLKIAILESDTLIVHNVSVYKLVYSTDCASVIYLSDCDLTEYDSIFKTCSTIYIFEDNQLQIARLCAESHQSIDAGHFIATLDNVTTLKTIEITNFDITNETANDISNVLYHNIQLQELHMNRNNLQPVNAIKIARALQNISTLRAFSIYNNNINDEAADDIATVIMHNTNLQYLNICNNNFKPIGTTKIAKALERIGTLTKLHVSNIITDEASESIATVVYHNVVQLQELVISESILQTTNGAKITEAMLDASTLSKLSFINCSFANIAISNIVTAVQHNTKLEEFYIHGNNLQEWDAVEIAKGLQQISSLKKLYIHSNNIASIATKDIATAISNNDHLQELNISENNIQDPGAKEIANSLLTISTLTKLNLCDNSITAEAANNIALALKNNLYLQELDISKNNFKSPGITIIAKALQSICTLRKLCLSKNNITVAASDDIATVISCNTNLQEFDIGSNNLQASGIITIATGLQKISTLTKLCLHDNNITDEATDDIAASILCNTKLEEFDVSGNKFQATGTTKIACALQEIPTLKKLAIS